MSDSVPPMTPLDDAALEVALADLAAAIDLPATPDIAAAVGTRLRATPSRRRLFFLPRGRLRWALAAALLAILVGGAIVAATGLGLPGLRILFVEPTPAPIATPSGSAGATAEPTATPTLGPPPSPTPGPTLALSRFGDPTTLERATNAMAFRVFIPDAAAVAGVVPSVYIDIAIPQGQVTLIYETTPELPAASTSPRGPSGERTSLLITETRGRVDEGFLQKTLGQNATITPVMVGDQQGFWISGAHELVFIDATGHGRPETLRDVGDVLVFVREGTLIRLESGLGLDRTLQIALGMH